LEPLFLTKTASNNRSPTMLRRSSEMDLLVLSSKLLSPKPVKLWLSRRCF